MILASIYKKVETDSLNMDAMLTPIIIIDIAGFFNQKKRLKYRFFKGYTSAKQNSYDFVVDPI